MADSSIARIEKCGRTFMICYNTSYSYFMDNLNMANTGILRR